ncbi:hypothetical protein LTR78_000667 [Recurvomyces mirabilis]|uniref:J domain-containing protein n=1 Tax=Recurvomyces mirabilis TaxID=574656 RepID=A0AAE0WY98_9PEZI|nr:hypothetical protein LTR78_000667 [Recurvomyces mirabilis]KAK5162321.1 hypothetical protein LTS14_000668 [Recurvomyces mirabilis]
MASTSPFDPFEALGVPRDASAATIKAQFRQLARRYHPNRQQGPEESKAALSDAFHTVRHAYKQLIDDNKRRRYVELLRLAEEQQHLLSRMADLLRESEHETGHSEAKDGDLSSDADDEDLPQMGLVRRQTVLKRSSTIKRSLEIASPPRKGRPPRLPTQAPASSKSEADYFARRRQKLEKLRRRELAAFETYKNAMVEKFEAEAEAESTREMYERAQWKREYFERAPRETTERLRSLQHYLGAIRAFGQLQPRRKNRSTVSYSEQILSTEDLVSGGYLDPNSATAHSSGRPSHSRAWSSDISNDQQTSSDEHSSGPGTPRPPTSFTWHRRHSRNTSLDDAFILPIISHSSELSRSSIPEHAPFKMLVKQPTGFRELVGNGNDNDDESSPESASMTPRTPSPGVFDCSSRYVMVGNQRLAAALRPARARTPSPSGATRAGAARPNGVSSHSSHQAVEPCHFLIKRIGKLEYRVIPTSFVHELSLAEKAKLLLEPDAEADPTDLLARLRVLDRNVSTKFEVKTDILESFRFRLIHKDHGVGSIDHDGFVALSYRRRRHAEKHQDHITLPLDEEMYQAVLEETGNLPLWLDQISIDGTSRLETAVSMSAMDMVYRSARLVVVALDDVELEGHEGTVLENHMEEYTKMTHVSANKRFRGKQPPYLDTRDELYGVLRKILRSSWFKRAWCRHEMRLARDHIFLVPCKSPGSWSGRNVVRFTTTCFTHLLALAIEVPFEPDVEKIKPALYAFFRDRSKLEPHERHLHSHHGNFTTVIAEVFGMEAGGDPRIPARQRAADALKDKVSIILNTMECGLAITQELRDPRMHFTTAEAHYMLLTLALAAQDPGALCSVGPPMRLVQADTNSPLTPTATSTWLFEPTNVDAGLNNYHTLGRLPADACIYTGLEMGEHYVQLDLKFLNRAEARHVHRADEDPDNLHFSRRFIEVCNVRKLGRNRARYLMTDTSANRHFGSMAEVYEQTLACVFACGPDWVEDICERYGVNRWKQDGEATWNLLVALKNTAGEWPEHAWGNQAAGFLVDFVNFLIIRGMPQRQILHREAWRPVWVATENGGRILTFVPPGEIMPAIPTALLDPDYVHLARLWVLQPRTMLAGPSIHIPSSWTLLGKSVIFSDDLAVQQLHSRSETWLEHQKVFGREDPEIQRLLRERSLYV